MDTTQPVIELFLAARRSPGTRRVYGGDLKKFLGEPLDGPQVDAFLMDEPHQIVARLEKYKAEMIAQGLAEATLNRRLACVRSLLKFAFRIGRASISGSGTVDGERVQTYRDTRGIAVPKMRALIDLPDMTYLGGLRDHAMLRLMCENGLRRAEVCHLTVEDFSATNRTIAILGKGKGTQRVFVAISSPTTQAIQRYLEPAGHTEGWLFRSLTPDPAYTDGRLTEAGLYGIVRAYGDQLGIKLSPHKLRHSAITAALDATGGDLRKVQRLSRHANIGILMAYDDNRLASERDTVDMLSGLLGK